MITHAIISIALGTQLSGYAAHGYESAVTGAVISIPPGEDRDAPASERAKYRRLERDIRKIDFDYEKLLQKSIEDAQNSEDGEVSLERQAELINLRDERDRLLNRLQLLALRHGWDLPDFSNNFGSGNAAGEGGEPRMTEKEQVFASAANEIRSRASEEAMIIARRIPLPITPVVVPR
ncbi:MAG: hypothetical protein AAGI17_07165 [Planctomycetota bacterium]